MKYYNDNLQILEKRFQEKTRDFKGFNDITEDDILVVTELIKRRSDDLSKKIPVTKYADTLSFLTNPRVHLVIPSTDAIVLFFIKTLDEDLVALKTYLSSNISSLEEIELQPKNIRASLLENWKDSLKKVATSIRSKIGFYNPILINFELAYFNKFLRTKQLLNVNHQPSLNHLLNHVDKNLSLDTLSDEDYHRLHDISIWYQETIFYPNIQNVSFNIVNQSELLGLKTTPEQLAFLIMNGDRDLNLLRIYEEESRLPEVKKRALEELGFYDPRLITLERAYQKRFMPDTKISIWSI